MENNIFSGIDETAVVMPEETQQRTPFILANTKEMTMEELGDMLTPVFSRDNVETISHCEGISTINDAVTTFFEGQEIKAPVIRCSHELKLRNKWGAGKLVENLAPTDSDSYMQRMIAMIEIPSISANINGSPCNLQVCIARNYADCNLLGNSSQFQPWMIGCGFLNTLCTNGLFKTDICNLNVKVTNTADLFRYTMELLQRYDYNQHIEEMRRLSEVTINISNLAQFLGRARMVSQMPTSMKRELGIPEFLLPEAQINQMVRDYYTDDNFGGFGKEISAWQFYMLLTNYKNNYIDVSLSRACNAFTVSKGIAAAVTKESDEWKWFIE